MAKVERNVLVHVGLLLARQFNVEPDGSAFAGVGALIGRFHQTRAAAGDHGKARIRQFARNRFGQFVDRVAGRNPRRPEDRHCRAQRFKTLGRLDEL